MSYASVKALREEELRIVAMLEEVRQKIQEELAWAIHNGEMIIEKGGLEVWMFPEEVDG